MPFDRNLPIGLMIEVPSAALTADLLARECDFFSIGTNDLTQYTLAVDRSNERVAHLFDPLHPGVLTLIDRSVRAARRAGIPVSLCGEMAGRPLDAMALLGLGLRTLSMSPGQIGPIKMMIRSLHLGEVSAFVDRLCNRVDHSLRTRLSAFAAERGIVLK